MRILSFLFPSARERRAALLFFGSVLLIGLLSFRQYGIPTDEGTMDSLGRDAYDYVFRGAEWPENPAWRYHGTVVELPLQIIENAVAAPDDVPHVYRRVYVRYFAVFLLWFAGLVALYALARRHFDSWRWALVTCAMYFLTPRFFAHSFYNSRDIPATTFFVLGMLTLLRMGEKRTVRSAILHGIATALALALRMPALILVVLTLLYLGMDVVSRLLTQSSLRLRQTLLLASVYLAVTAMATVAFWPFLWQHPFAHFVEAYRFMSSLGGETVLFGHTYAHMPWSYIPAWMLITTPVLYTAFFLCGFLLLLAALIRHPLRMIIHAREDLLMAAWFVLPILSVVLSGAGIYNEWRHVYFVYPAFLLVAVSGMWRALDWCRTKRNPLLRQLVPVALGVQLSLTGLWMLRNHPLEFAYFSLPTRVIDAVFTPGRVDYWGLSYREAVRYVLTHNQGVVSIYSPENIAFQNAYNVFPTSLSRIMRVPTPEEAMYVLVSSPDAAGGLPVEREIRVDGHYLSGVYRGPVQEVTVDRATGKVDFKK